MVSALHGKQTYLQGVHSIVAYLYADETARLTATGFDNEDLWKVAYQEDDGTFWVLINTDSTWQQLGAGAGSSSGSLGGDGDSGAAYLVLNATSSLSRERVLSVSGSSGLLASDAGPNGVFSLSINNNFVATLTGSVFSGPVNVSSAGLTGSLTGSFSGRLSGSLTRIESGDSYLVAVGGISITTQSNGQVLISGSVDTSNPPLQGTGVLVNGYTVSINDNVVATLSGSTFTGPIITNGLTGSLQSVALGVPYLLSQGGITITTQSNGQIIISGAIAGGGLPPTAGTGILVNGTTVSINDNVVATISGSTFTGPILAQSGLSGSLQRTSANLPYLLSQGGVSLITQSNGQIIISGSAPQNPTAGLGIFSNGSTISINDNIVATITGSTFTGPISASSGLSGSLQRIAQNLPYLLSQGGITITTQSNGQIIISSSVGGGAAPSAGNGILVNGSTIAINDNIVATISGSRFTGPVIATTGLSGSLQRTSGDLPYLLSQGGITITTQSNGQIIISGTADTNTLPAAGTGILVSGNTVSINNAVVATLTGSVFSGPLSASNGLSGSLQQIGPNLRYLIATGGVSITTQSNGQIIISGSSYINPIPGTGILVNGATLSINNAIVATITGANFTGPVLATNGLTGSLQTIGTNLPYLLSQGGISITTQSNGQIIISGSAGGGSNPVAGTGILVNGATVSINNNAVATITGALFTGPVSASAGLSGSLQRVGPNLPYLLSQGAVTLTTQSNGQIIVSASSGVTSITPGNGVSVTGWTVSINNAVVATVSGTTFTGPISASSGLSGSLQMIGPNLPYLLSQGGITLITQSNGQVIISGAVGTAGPAGPTGPAGSSGFVDGNVRLKTTSSVSITSDNTYANENGSDVFFYVSGSIALSGSSARRSVFKGDTVISGNLLLSRSVTFQAEHNFGNRSSAAPTFDFSVAQKFSATLTSNLTASFVNPVGATNIQLVLRQDSSGNRTVFWPSSVKWPTSGSRPTLTTQPNGIDIISFYYDGSGNYYGAATLQFV